MAAQHASGVPFPSPAVFIDLTSSDDENGPPNRAAPDLPPRTSATEIAQSLPSSNHGLILPWTFNSTKANPRTQVQDRREPVAQTYVPGPPRVETPILPPANTNRRATEQSFPNRTIITAADRTPVVDLEPPAKRRKTYGGVLQKDAISLESALKPPHAVESSKGFSRPAPILPSVKNRPSLLNRPHAIQPNGRTQNEARSPSLSSTNGLYDSAKRKVSKADRLQADEIRKPLNTVVLNQQALTPEDNEAYNILQKQVLEHVNPALDLYQSSISNKVRFDLGKRVVRELEDYVKANKRRPPAEYESELSAKAQSLVHNYASELLHGKGVELVAISKELPNETTVSLSSRSGSEEELFETSVEHIAPHPHRASRQSSSSPTTSFSIDVNDGPSPMDLDEPEIVDTNCTKRFNSATIPPEEESVNDSIEVSSDTQLYRHEAAARTSRRLPLRHQRPRFNPSETVHDSKPPPTLHCVRYLTPGTRPYLSFQERADVRRGLELTETYRGLLSKSERQSLSQSIYHVDLGSDELEFIFKIVQGIRRNDASLSKDVRSDFVGLMRGQASVIPRVISTLQEIFKTPGQEPGRALLQNRDTASIKAFLRDAVQGKISTVPQCSRFESSAHRRHTPQKPRISTLLRQREIYGMTPVRLRRGQQPSHVEISSYFEDSLVAKSEWTDCCGDISTMSWTGEATFVCGATAHSDYHNMQYNKPGNLAVGSTSLDTLRGVADHRILRPIIATSDNAENALESMRQTQDPWLYTSVVSSSYCAINGFTFTASFDHTVKIWHVAEDGSIDLRGSWLHDGKVNFVVTSSSHERVATASDVSSNAIRVYKFEEDAVSLSPHDTYCGEKALEQAQDLRNADKWAYFPATIQWGKAPGVIDFLLVGYSPRSITGQDVDIPEEKKNSGELCLWNVEYGTRIPISSTRTQNVFEVMWHPTQPIFLAATSPQGTFERETRTQVRIFAQNETGSFLQIKALDCPALDINELTIMPNSRIECYVTASCTDGITYVWDTAQGDRPIHILGHSESVDELIHDLPREIADTGVKFAAWGKTVDRFYTGSSDGKVKAWDIRKPKGCAFVRTVLSVSGVITAGAFSTNFRKLLIGDATGKVHLLEVDGSDIDGVTEGNHSGTLAKPQKIGNSAILAKRSEVFLRNSQAHGGVFEKKPKVLIPHPEPPHPEGFRLDEDEGMEDEMTAQDMAQAYEGHYAAQAYLNEGYLTMHPERAIGAVQGPNYLETGLFLKVAHQNEDSSLPLLPEWQDKQQSAISHEERSRPSCLPLPKVTVSDQALHKRNADLDLDFSKLSLSTQAELLRDGVDLDFEPAQDFDYELAPRSNIFKRHQKRMHNM